MKADKYKVNVTDLSDWKAEKRVEYATLVIYGHRLQLLATLNGGFEVVLDGEVKSQQIQPFPATEYYNELVEEILS